MNKNLKEMRLHLKELKKTIENNYYVVYNLHNFLINYQKEFKKKESLEALKRIADFLKPREKEYEIAKSKYQTLKEEMPKICSHEIIVRNEQGCYYCPICNENFYQSSPEDSIYSSTMYSSTRYIIETQGKKDDDISKIVDEALMDENNFLENIKSELAKIQFDSNIKLKRR